MMYLTKHFTILESQNLEVNLFHPDRPFHIFGDSKYVARRALTTWSLPISWSWGFEIGKGAGGRQIANVNQMLTIKNCEEFGRVS